MEVKMESTDRKIDAPASTFSEVSSESKVADLEITEIDRLIQILLGPEPGVIKIPETVEGVRALLLHLRKTAVQSVTIRVRRDPPSPVSDLEWRRIGVFLSTMWHLKVMDPLLKTEGKLDTALQLICDVSNKYPENYARAAQAILDKFEAVGWGASAPPALVAEPADGLSDNTQFPHDNDPIFGIQGIMHHILRVQKPKSVSYSIRPGFKSKDSKVYGNNGLLNGQCFPVRMAALRDGAHGQSMGGIAGNVEFGAYSIVVSGHYDDLDEDHGETLYYSGSNSHGNTTPEPTDSIGTRCLVASVGSQRPVRVLRSADGKWAGAPRAGIRYDGLYKVESVALSTNTKGGAYKRFKLKRNPGQAPIMTMEPGTDLIRSFERVRQGYTGTMAAAPVVNSPV